MKIISIDVGIKNCSFCVLSHKIGSSPVMDHWDIVNLMELNTVAEAIYECTCVNHVGTKKEKKCVKRASYKKGSNTYMCTSHAKKDAYFGKKELEPAALKKASLPELIRLTNKYYIDVKDAKKKAELMALLVAYQTIHGITLIVPSSKKKKCATIGLQIIGRNIVQYFDALNVCDVTHVIIENQIGPLATKMKTVQGMLMQYFIMRNAAVCVEFISATNKLKDFSSESASMNTKETNKKKEYNARKKQAVSICADIIQTTETLVKWNDYFQSCKKKDDLSDCFLQGVWFLRKHNV